MACPVHEDGHECTVKGAHKVGHATRIYEDGDEIGKMIYWFDPQPPPSPTASRQQPSNTTLIDIAHGLEVAAGPVITERDPLGDDFGKVGRDHPDTSKVAARNASVRHQKQQLLELVRAAGDDGLTCFEAAPRLGVSPNQTATRMMELREQGLVWRDIEGPEARKRPTTPGNKGFIHWATNSEG